MVLFRLIVFIWCCSLLPSRFTVLESYATLDECSFTQCNFKHWLKWCTYSAVLLLHGWCHVKLLPSQCTFCAHHTAMHQFTVLFEATYYIYICVFSCNLPPVLLAEWPWSFACYCSNMGRGGWNGCWRVSTESWPWGRKFAHHSWWDLNLQPFDHESGTLPMGYPCSLDHSLWVCLLGQTSHKESQISCFCHHTPYQALAQTSAQTYWKLNNKKIQRWIITQNN